LSAALLDGCNVLVMFNVNDLENVLQECVFSRLNSNNDEQQRKKKKKVGTLVTWSSCVQVFHQNLFQQGR
jgi:hypothetical protein